MLRQQHAQASMSGKSAKCEFALHLFSAVQRMAAMRAATAESLLRAECLLWVAPALQEFFSDFRGRFVSTVVCPACLCFGIASTGPPSRDIASQCPAGQWMNSASEVPIGLSTSEDRRHSRSVLALG